jgi:flavin-dependent dehydrogenase
VASAAPVDFDVVIAGGGPAGAAAARELSSAGWRIAVVDGDRRRPVPARAETLPGAARPLLERLGAADAVDDGAHLPALARRSHWGADVSRERSAVLDPYGEGRHVDRARFDAALRAGAEAAGARWTTGTVQAVRSVDQNCFELALGGKAGGRLLRARGIIDATGRSARVARSLGARLLHLNRMVAACATAAPAASPENTGLVEAAPDGWWYSAPIANGRYAVQFVTLPQLWSGDRSLSNRLRSSPRTASRLDPSTVTAPTLGVCGSSRLDRCAGPGWAAAGDAAGAHDPLAAAGLTMALRSGLRAAQALAAWLRAGRLDELDTYDRMQRAAFDSYLRERSAIYSLERRWPTSPFWAQPDPHPLAFSSDG